MCDTMVTITDDGVLFAKNSDRDPNEAQVIEWHPAADHEPNAIVKTTWIEIEQVPRTHAIVISRPWWMWGAEMGANEHGLVIGNEAVFTKESTRGDMGLLGMDLLRLALERACSADEAVQMIVELLERHGQVGSCSFEHPKFTYHNSFLIADPQGAIVLETAGRQWATEKVNGRARSISNGLTITGFAEKYRDRLRGAVAGCAVRQPLTQKLASNAVAPSDLMAALRNNGTGSGPDWSLWRGSMVGPNMHAGGLLAASQTVASWVSDLRSEPVHWATGTADPALSLFKPIRIDQPADFGPIPNNKSDSRSLWWRHERLHRRAAHNWSRSVSLLAAERDALETRWLEELPSTEQAFVIADEVERGWLNRIWAETQRDERPFWSRYMWDRYNASANFSPEIELEESA